jgi:hypothetical protein
MGPEFAGKTGLTIGGSSGIGKAVGTLQLEKRAEAFVIMGKNQKKLPVAKSLQCEALRPPGFVEFVSASSRDFTPTDWQSLQDRRVLRFWADAINILHRGTQ